jgi:hypothetical protein
LELYSMFAICSDNAPPAPNPLSPEEDAIGDPDDLDDEIDDLLPADLWF